MRIPEDKIEEIRNSVDIVDYINQFVPLRKVGKNYFGLCPFHTEKTPSFSVNSDKQIYHCFGCGTGGNVFNFVMQYEKVSFYGALKKVAEYAGIELPKIERGRAQIGTEFEELYEAIHFAEQFFTRILMKTPEGKKALEYLYKRGIKDSTISIFKIGYALDQWDGLVQYAMKQNFSLELLERAGLIIKRGDGSYYDRFRGRIMFPIFSVTGRGIAFGGRRLVDDENTPKYINSPETKIYTKSKVLYGLYQAKDAIRKKGYAILVEGYMDCISLFQAGIENVIASGGTALTDMQVRLISNYTDKIYFLYDADSAGAMAMLRGIDIILAQGLDVYVVELPEGEDPDSFIYKNSASELEKLIERAVNFIDFKASFYQRLGKFDDPNVKSKAIRSLVASISKIPRELERSIFIKEIASKYKLREEVLAQELELILSKNKKIKQKEIDQKEDLEIIKFKSIPPEEKGLAKILIDADKTVLEFVFKYVKQEDIKSEYVKIIYQNVQKAFEESKETGDYKKLNIHELLYKFDDEGFRNFITYIAIDEPKVSKHWKERKEQRSEDEIMWKALDDILTVFYLRKIKKIEDELIVAIREAEENGDEEKISYLLKRKSDIDKAKNTLSKSGFISLIKGGMGDGYN